MEKNRVKDVCDGIYFLMYIPTSTLSIQSDFGSLRVLRYAQGHIWACPPSEGDDYIFHCHPPDQKIPKPKRLQEWYRKMLDKAFAERILHDYKVRKRNGLLNGLKQQ